MIVSTELRNEVASIRLNGKFIFADHKAFRQAVKESLATSCKTLEIDFAKVDYLDSSALGMLLLAREEASVAGQSIVLLNCQGTVGQILALANFQKLFTIR
jgi:HptB-dependent secretion and biofilm anti anti-sigma factor